MKKNYTKLLLVSCLFVGLAGCSVATTGKGSWEIYGGVRSTQEGPTPVKVELKSTVVDTIVDSLTKGIQVGDNKISDGE